MGSVYDGLFMISSMLTSSFRLTGIVVIWLSSVCNCVWFFCRFTSAYVIISVTVERTLSITKPFLMEKYRKTRFALKVSLVFLALGVLVILPQMVDEFTYVTHDGGCDVDNQTQATHLSSVYTLYVTVTLNFVLPFMVVLAMNVWFAWTLFALRRSNTRQCSLPAENGTTPLPSRDEGLIRLTVGLTCWYTVCWLVPGTYYIIRLPT
ncbi:uncharacterized protein LOC131944345, partial [Physella acuta]|uniref:uncharacterized protein LOC131944345 n=1 Tax=Physella acuta TaxID=109671 RepID=UPI0027DB7E42